MGVQGVGRWEGDLITKKKRKKKKCGIAVLDFAARKP